MQLWRRRRRAGRAAARFFWPCGFSPRDTIAPPTSLFAALAARPHAVRHKPRRCAAAGRFPPTAFRELKSHGHAPRPLRGPHVVPHGAILPRPAACLCLTFPDATARIAAIHARVFGGHMIEAMREDDKMDRECSTELVEPFWKNDTRSV
jgi:hypothetical protein